MTDADDLDLEAKLRDEWWVPEGKKRKAQPTSRVQHQLAQYRQKHKPAKVSVAPITRGKA